MTRRPVRTRAARFVAAAALLVALLAPASPGIHDAPPVRAVDGGCSLSSSTCFFFDVTLQTGPGAGTGFGTYRTKNPIDATYTRIVCDYGNEEQSGVCGWGYQVDSPGEGFKVLYSVLPDPGSQACRNGTCYDAEFEGFIDLFGNYAEASWTFLLISAVQINAEVKGSGTGTVVSDPPGIRCPDDCDDLFAANLPVTLTAKPSTGSVFTGWSGACSGTNKECVVTTDFLVTATATFNKKTTPPPATEPPDEETEPPPTEEMTAEPATDAPTEAPTTTLSAVETAAATQDSTVGSGTGPSPTADASTTAAPGGGSNVPIVIGLVVLLLVLAGGAIFAFRRGGGSAGA